MPRDFRWKCRIFEQNFHLHFHLKSKGMILSSYFFTRQTGLSA